MFGFPTQGAVGTYVESFAPTSNNASIGFTAIKFTWQKPEGPYSLIRIYCWGAGGGGGSGRRGLAGTLRNGGGGGGSGGFGFIEIPYSYCPGFLTLNVGVGGVGAALPANSSDGNVSGAGGQSSVSLDNWPQQFLLVCAGAFGGGLGTAAAGGQAGAGALISSGMVAGVAGGAASNTGVLGSPGADSPSGIFTSVVPTGGGAGAGITSGNTTSLGAQGGVHNALSSNQASQPSYPGDSVYASSGIGNVTRNQYPTWLGGLGGGGGSSGTTANASGGRGGFPGGGGGGGAATVDGSTNGGAGGDGGHGCITVICY